MCSVLCVLCVVCSVLCMCYSFRLVHSVLPGCPDFPPTCTTNDVSDDDRIKLGFRPVPGPSMLILRDNVVLCDISF